MKLGTKLTLYLSVIIILVLSGYGYFHILSRRDLFIRKMKIEVQSTARTLKVSLEKISLPKEMEYVQDLIDAVEEYEKTLGVIVYHQGKNLILRSRSVEGDIGPHLELIKKSVEADLPQEAFRLFGKVPVFSYAFPLKDRAGKSMGGVTILQYTSFMEEDIRKAKRDIFIMMLLVIGGTVALVLFATRRWVTMPISQLMRGIKEMAKGDLDTRIDLGRGDELSELGKAFNQMAGDLKKAQEQLIREGEVKLELERNLRQSEKLATIGQLASGLAHEIGTPLNIISGRAELMKRRLEDKQGLEKNLDVILNQTERITKIIQQLLGFVRKKKPEQRPLHLSPLVETTLDFLDPQIQRQKIRLVKELKDQLPPVTGDPDQLQQVFLNLILNAIQSMPQGGDLRLVATRRSISKEGLEESERPYVEIRVEDTGIGMEREVVENIFSPFFTTKEKEKGTGLGLTVSQGIIQDHEGWVEVESEVGKGSVFKVYLPAAGE
ncbi:MAG: ATP-binding protein [Thermodesulfobacteriota bacterium]